MAKKKLLKPVRIFKKRPCMFCRDKVEAINYKEVDVLRRFVSERGKIVPSRLTGNCAKHQRMVAKGVKKARLAALLPFVAVKEGLMRRGHDGAGHSGRREK